MLRFLQNAMQNATPIYRCSHYEIGGFYLRAFFVRLARILPGWSRQN